MRGVQIFIIVLAGCLFISFGAVIHYRAELADCIDSRAEIATTIHEIRGSISAEIIKIKGIIREQKAARRKICDE